MRPIGDKPRRGRGTCAAASMKGRLAMKLERDSGRAGGTVRRMGLKRWQGAVALVVIALLIAGFVRVLTGRLGTSGAGTVQTCADVQSAHAAGDAGGQAVYISAFLGSSPDSVLYAFSPSDGALRWCDRFALTHGGSCPLDMSCPAPPSTLLGEPLAADDTVYVCADPETQHGTLYALDARDGSVRWSRQTDCAVVSMPFGDSATPVAGGGVVYSGAYALRAADGHVLWRSGVAESFAAVQGGVVYAYSPSRNAVYALSATDGAVRWSYTLNAPLAGVPSATPNTVYAVDLVGDEAPGPIGPNPTATPDPRFAPTQPDLFVLDAATGALRWKAAVGPLGGASAVESGGAVYITSRGGLHALDAATGTARWSLTLPALGTSTVRLDAGTLYVADDGVYAVNAADGAIRWHEVLGFNQSISFSDVVLMGGRLFVARVDGSGQGTLYALDAHTGAVVWQRDSLGELGAPVVG